MFKYFLKRLAQMVVTLFIVSILVFVLANFIGDPVNMLVSPKAPGAVRIVYYQCVQGRFRQVLYL